VADDRQGARPAPARLAQTVGVALTLLLAICALMGWWTWATATGRIGDVLLLQRPQGSPVVLSLQPVTALLDPTHYAVGRRSQRVVVEGDPSDLQLGYDVTLHGVLEDGFVRETSHTVAEARPAKRKLGLVGLLLAVVAAAAGVRPTTRGWRLSWPTS
jgi:hypothetical protein